MCGRGSFRYRRYREHHITVQAAKVARPRYTRWIVAAHQDLGLAVELLLIVCMLLCMRPVVSVGSTLAPPTVKVRA
jgi:hypothetical protein